MPTLLLADDNVTVQRVIALTFASEPVRVVSVADGRLAMERVLQDPPDIVLAGTTLPHVSGYELARFVRTHPELNTVPVLLLSGAFESVDAALVTSSGAAGVVEKPVEPIALVNRVKELLRLKDAGAQSAFASQSPTRSAPELTDQPGNPVFEVDDQWFTGQPTAPTRGLEQRLANEMGIHDIDLPEARPVAPPLTEDDAALESILPTRLDATSAPPESMGVPLDRDGQPAFDQGRSAVMTPVITSEMLDSIAAKVAARLKDSVRIEPVAPPLTEGMLAAIATEVSHRLSRSLRVEPAVPRITDDMLAHLAQVVAEELRGQVISRLQETIHVEPAAPVITEAMQAAIAVHVAQRLAGSIRVEPAAPHLTEGMLAQIAGQMANHLRDAVAASVRDSVREAVLDTAERLVRAEIERIRAKAESSQA